jgi:lipopolysaccharide-induced tumor necrosis factor-alpha factor
MAEKQQFDSTNTADQAHVTAPPIAMSTPYSEFPPSQPSYTQQPQQYQYPPMQPMQQAMPLRPYFTKEPERVTCPNCHKSIITQVRHENGTATYLIAFGCMFIICCLAPVAFFVDDCKDHLHYCPNCQTLIGYKRLIN